ncbi:hypothetical protein ABPG74_013596 [Tetrahymena malaccensis]
MIGKFVREEFIELAKVSEKTERYDEMIGFMLIAAKFEQDFSEEDRKLFSLAIKKSTIPKRNACAQISSIQEKQDKDEQQYRNCIQSYKLKIGRELIQICEDILEVADNCLNNKTITIESKVFYLKIKGDSYRILAEQDFGNAHTANDAFEAYSLGYDIAQQNLCPLNSNRLSLTNNFCVLFYEILHDPTKACLIGQKLINLALNHKEAKDCDKCNDLTSKTALCLLVDNVKYWKYLQSENDQHPEEM